MKSNLNKYKQNICKNNIKIRVALSVLNLVKIKCLIVIDKKRNFIGTLTDGDIRRSLLSGIKFTETVNKCVNKKSFILKYDDFKTLKNSKDLNIPEDVLLIPVLNQKKKIVDIVKNPKSEKFNTSNKNFNTQVFIMAGGMGTRLRPYSSIIPKPLIPIDGKPLIEHIMDKFLKYNFKKFTISVNNDQKIIKTFFKSNKKKYEIIFLSEKKALGTAGSLSLINKIPKDLIVINCDSIIDSDYDSILKYHRSNKNDLTVVVAKKRIDIPYGVFELNKNSKIAMIEKPSNEILINTGMYIFSGKILSVLKKNKRLEMDQLIKDLISKKNKIDLFPIDSNSWHDFGQLNSFFQNKKNFLKFNK
tara:strand:- start:5898 stop:6974 length:1077 start_codon:yes stop_codon:yes gene_type:complete